AVPPWSVYQQFHWHSPLRRNLSKSPTLVSIRTAMSKACLRSESDKRPVNTRHLAKRSERLNTFSLFLVVEMMVRSARVYCLGGARAAIVRNLELSPASALAP